MAEIMTGLHVAAKSTSVNYLLRPRQVPGTEPVDNAHGRTLLRMSRVTRQCPPHHLVQEAIRYRATAYCAVANHLSLGPTSSSSTRRVRHSAQAMSSCGGGYSVLALRRLRGVVTLQRQTSSSKRTRTGRCCSCLGLGICSLDALWQWMTLGGCSSLCIPPSWGSTLMVMARLLTCVPWVWHCSITQKPQYDKD